MIRQNKNLIILFVLLCLASAAISYLEKFKSLGLDPEMFRLPADVVIDEIILRNDGDSVLVTGGNGGWKVNKKYDADLDRVRLIFAVMDRVRPRRLAGDSMMSQINNSGVTVEFREKKNKTLSVKVWGDPKSGYTWFSRTTHPTPAEMFIPGYRSSLINVFSTSEEDWRDKRIFNFNWRNFISLQNNIPGQPENGFSISVQDGLLSIQEIAEPDTTRLKNYMDAVQLLEGNSIIALPDFRKDSLLAVDPDAILSLIEISGRKHELRLFSNGLVLRDSVDLFSVGSQEQNLLRLRRKAFIPRAAVGSSVKP